MNDQRPTWGPALLALVVGVVLVGIVILGLFGLGARAFFALD